MECPKCNEGHPAKWEVCPLDRNVQRPSEDGENTDSNEFQVIVIDPTPDQAVSVAMVAAEEINGLAEE